MGYEVDAVVDGKAQIGAVFLGERREVDAHPRHVHALARTQCTVIFNGADEFVFLFAVNDETQFAIVDEHMSAHLEVLHEVHVVHRDTFGRGELLRITHDAHGLSLLELDGCFAGRGTHFGAFGVDEDTDVGADGAHVFNDTTHTFGGLVGGVETHHVHTGIIEFLEQFDVATHIRNGGDNFGLFVHYLVFVFLTKDRNIVGRHSGLPARESIAGSGAAHYWGRSWRRSTMSCAAWWGAPRAPRRSRSWA